MSLKRIIRGIFSKLTSCSMWAETSAADRLLFGFSVLLVPAAIIIVTFIAALAWPAHYKEFSSAASIPFQALEEPKTGIRLDPAAARYQLRNMDVGNVFELQTHLSEQPFWLLFSPAAEMAASSSILAFPSRHALRIVCWDADTLLPLGEAGQISTTGMLARAKAGFALSLSANKTSRLICNAQFSGPARITVQQWPLDGFLKSQGAFDRDSGLLDGGLAILTIFIALTALINREWIHVLFAAWMVANLRIAALSAGFDTHWFGQEIPLDWIFPLRRIAMTSYCALTIILFSRLFATELKQVGCSRLLTWVRWSIFPLLICALVMPYRYFLPVFWTLSVFSVGSIIFAIARILMIARSTVAIWYALSIATTVAANFNEVIAASIGIGALIGVFNSVTAALISSLMAALAIAEQIRQDRIAKRKAEEELHKTYDAMPIGLFTLDRDGSFLRINPSLQTMVGVPATPNTTWAGLFGMESWLKLARALELETTCEMEISLTDGELKRSFLVRATSANDQIEGSLQDITQRTLATEQLQFLAEHDPLTRMLNRRGLEAVFNRLSSRALALAYIDLDRFKLINDLHGHSTGDAVLKQICTQISSLLQPGMQHLGRVGGDEFVIIFDSDDIAACETQCQDIIGHIFNQLFHADEKAFLVNASIGLIEVAPATRLSDAISTADRACRSGKASGTNSVVVYRKDAAEFAERAEELRIMQQIEQNEFPKGLLLYAQPFMSLSEPYQSLNFEFLLRMKDAETSDIISAFKMIKTAEISGRIAVIDRWVFLTTLEWLENHHNQLGNTRVANVNLSGGSMNDARFVEDVFAMLADHPNAARKLCIEITESVALNDIEHSRRFVERANKFGTRLALDDFGAGYTSFSYLRQLSADAIKIDGQFVIGATSHPANMAIVSAISDLSRNLGMQSIAEWVEDLDTLKALVDIGIDHVQGFVICRPLPLDQLLTMNSAADFIQDPDVAAYVRSLQTTGAWGMQDFNLKGLH